MRKSKPLVVFSLIVLSGFGAIGSAASVAAAPNQSPLSQTEIHRQQGVRKLFGLSTRLSAMEQASADGTSSTKELGIPLSAAETAEMQVRDKYPHIVDEVEAADAHVLGYAGAWVDQADNATLHIMSTRADAAAVSKATGSVAASSMRVVVDASSTYSLAQLSTFYSKIGSQFNLSPTLAKSLSDFSIDVQNNRVHLNLLAGTPPSVQEKIVKGLPLGSYMVSYVSSGWSSQSRNRTSPPIYGGTYISNAAKNCTAGYAGALSTSGNPYLVTAGHCGSGNYYQGENEAGSFIGSGKDNNFVGLASSSCDCVGIGILPSGYASKLVLTSDTATYAYTHSATSGNYTAGQKACLSGAVYAGTHSGGILCTTTAGSGTASYSGFMLEDAGFLAGQGSAAGDSGGPWGQSTAFLGIHAAVSTTTNRMALSKAANITASGLRLTY